MRTKIRSRLSLLFIALAALIAIPAVAIADNIHNDANTVNPITTTGKNTITAGGSTTIKYWIAQTGSGNDGQQGCNAADNTPLVLTINAPAGVNVSGATLSADKKLTFTECGEPVGQSVTFSSSTVGNHNITHTYSDARPAGPGTGTYDNRANFTLIVQQAQNPNTAPELSLPADINATATSSSGAVVNYEATANDAEDGPLTPTCNPASGSQFPLGLTAVQCSVTDSGGLSDSGQFNVFVTYAWGGLLQPINGGSTMSTGDDSSVFKKGSTIPVKFQLTGASAGISDATAKLYVAKVQNGVAGTETEATSSTSASSGSEFRYDSSNAQYVYNLGTKGDYWAANTTYQLRVDLGDGDMSRVTWISLKK